VEVLEKGKPRQTSYAMLTQALLAEELTIKPVSIPRQPVVADPKTWDGAASIIRNGNSILYTYGNIEFTLIRFTKNDKEAVFKVGQIEETAGIGDFYLRITNCETKIISNTPLSETSK
jgi:hypothetical protein